MKNQPFPHHVLMTADTLGGVWTHAIELARALDQQGVKVTLATMGAPLNAAQQVEVRHIPGLQVYQSAFRLEWMEDPWDDVGEAGEWLLRIEERVRPDIIHLNSFVHAALPWRAPVVVAAHSCVLSWYESVRGTPAPPEWNAYRDAVARGLRAAGQVVAPTRWMAETLERHYSDLPPIQVVPNGRDPGLFHQAAAAEFVITAGRLWDEAKNVAALDRAAACLEVPVYAAGDANHPDGAPVSLRHLRPLGPLAPSVLARWLACASIYALPARYEPFGLSALEAALSGCALVLGDIPSLRQVWGTAAVFVPPEDDQALLAALRGLLQDPVRRAELAARARARALEYTPGRMLAGWLEVYRSLEPMPSRRPVTASEVYAEG